jgi:predicted N-acetyltransferase YhbS
VKTAGKPMMDLPAGERGLAMDVTIRRETEKDHEAVFELVRLAFENAEYGDHDEQFLVERLRRSQAFVPELSLVAESRGRIVGHIMFSELVIETENVRVGSLTLAPVSVLPECQKRGIGSKLITKGLSEAKRLGYGSVLLVGHAHYYPRFGFRRASGWGIRAPFDVPDEAFMAVELEEGALANAEGTMILPAEFFG